MENKILNSNKFKRFKLYIYLFSGLYLAIIIFFLLFITMFVRSESDSRVWMFFGAVVGIFGLVFIPIILAYLINLVIIKKNIKEYKEYNGTITNIETLRYVRTDSRAVVVNVEELSKSFNLKVYLGDLYDEVYKGAKVEIAYNKDKDDAIILGVVI